MTNEEKIKSLSTEELAERLVWKTRDHAQGADDIWYHSPSGFFDYSRKEAVEDCINWLKEEAK